jgi:flavin-dependent dehydrogenase
VNRIRCDVCVVGGGPAGSTIAQRLATFGHDVLLIEREGSPRPRIGATLPPSILPLLECIGARDRVEAAGFHRSKRVVMWWSEGKPTVREQVAAPGFHVDRGIFDRLLLENAAAQGVRVLQPAHATRFVRSDADSWTISLRHDDAIREVHAHFIVDATGARNILWGRRQITSLPLLALFAEWNAYQDDALMASVEAGEQEWFWCAPIGVKRFVAAVLVDPKSLRAGEGIHCAYERLLRRFRLFHPIADRIIGRVQVCDASSRHAEELVGPGFIRVGDSAFTLDPLSSQGVQSAMAGSLQAAIVTNVLMNDPTSGDAMALYRDRQTERVKQYARKTASFYAERASVCGTSFWRDRGPIESERQARSYETRSPEMSCRIELARTATFEFVPSIRGDTIQSTLAVRHEALDGPVAFLDQVELVPLLRRIQSGQTIESLVGAWSEGLSTDRTWAILKWLWERRVVVSSATC